MARLLEGKVAIITGSGRGIGREEALLMAKHGAKIVVNDLGAHFDGSGQATGSPAQEVVSEIKKTRCEAVANGDSVAELKSAQRIIQYWPDPFGKLNIVANDAADKAALAAMAIIIDREMSKYGVTSKAIAPIARTRLTVDATPSTAAIMGREVQAGEFDAFGPQHVAPLVAWLASDDAKDVHGEVFRVGAGTVWLMQGWHTVGKVSKRAVWDAADLGTALKTELGKGATAKEDMGGILAKALQG